jgi:hypothetical protein
MRSVSNWALVALVWCVAVVAAWFWWLALTRRRVAHPFLGLAPTRRDENPALYWWLMTCLGWAVLVLAFGAAVLTRVALRP